MWAIAAHVDIIPNSCKEDEIKIHSTLNQTTRHIVSFFNQLVAPATIGDPDVIFNNWQPGN
jgi:hypothetical protein